MRRGPNWFSAAVALVDLALLALALLGAWASWLVWRPHLDRVLQARWWELWLPNDWMPPGLLIIGAWLALLAQLGYYTPSRALNFVRSAQMLTRATVGALLVVVVVQFFLPDRRFSRFLVVMLLGQGFTLLALWRWVFLRLRSRMDLGLPVERVAIVGCDREAQLMAQRLRREGSASLQLAGYICPVGLEHGVVPEREVLGLLSHLRELVNQHRLDTLVLATRNLDREQALVLSTRCNQMGLRLLQVPFTWGIVSPRLELAELGQLQLIDISRLQYGSTARALKRAFDLGGVLVLGGLALPILLLAALLVRLDSPGPALYVSQRVGRGGRAFPFFKLRTMVAGADAQKEALRAQNESSGALFKLRADPRVTRVGRWLRRWSIDELPQLWNVLRGDMDLVGPRPLPLRDLESIRQDLEIAYWFELRHQVPPGITGLWQVSGRSELGFREMVQLDIYYVQNWSFWLDMKILLQTVPAVLRGRGAV